MKYTYAYKTSDGIRHEDSMNASSREEVFERLRERGIRAIKVVAADGSKANGAPPRRNVAVYVLSTVLVLLTVTATLYFTLSILHSQAGQPESTLNNATAFLTSHERRQVIGDVAIVEKGIASGWADVFPDEGERFFASFAIPGVKAGQRNTTVEELTAALKRKIAVRDNDGMEARQIKAMVEGMKDEARRYIAAGGSMVEYGKRLVERQEAEIAIYNRIKAEAEKNREKMAEDAFETYLEGRNDELRNLGIKPVVLSD